ncbi:hypothetical protein PGS49_21795 [Yersinia intermedia]|uniref:hypothetical protein n=1 Tax=Yersinia intermedia TaxID=631 RepID=UPI0022FDDA04|nr:hypothetical protein [Yersinia intermedia]MDA5483249.1 hypothetical protein [Yersinia intermedia]
MKQPIKCDPDILKLLKRVDSQYIDYLVDVITDNGNDRISRPKKIRKRDGTIDITVFLTTIMLQIK